MRNTFIFSVMAFLLFSSFERGSNMTNHTDTPAAKLEDHKWYLSVIYKADGYTQVMTRKAFIFFNTAEGKVSGNGSCNSFGGKVTAEGNTLSFGHLFSTKMYCQDVQSIEDDLFGKLQKVTRYEIKGDTLLLYEGDNLVFEFVE
ncbi:MAG: META domain-containing protein [Chitinophagaceae bacterium]|nr:META domain-containing protein [Chitinophagaceae bacterium]